MSDYIAPWLAKGFEEDALKLIARYCFAHNIRAFEGLNQTVCKFYEKGLVTAQSINRYVSSVVAEDENVKQILEECGLVKIVSSPDRKAYKTWTQVWGFSFDVVKYAASLSTAAANPITYMNKILSEFKAEGITTVEQAQARSPKVKTEQKAAHNYNQRVYTAEQLNALFDELAEV